MVDSGSRDDTVALAQRCGARVVEHAWEGYGPQKNFAVAQARHDWVLCIDADERVTPELGAADPRAVRAPARRRPPRTRSRAATAFSAAGWRMAKAIRTGTCGCSTAAARAGPTIRCTSMSSPTAPVARLRGDLQHASAESIDAYIAKQNRYTSLQAAAMHARGERASALARRAVAGRALLPLLRDQARLPRRRSRFRAHRDRRVRELPQVREAARARRPHGRTIMNGGYGQRCSQRVRQRRRGTAW